MIIIMDKTQVGVTAIQSFTDKYTRGLDSNFDYLEIECLPNEHLINENYLVYKGKLFIIKEVEEVHDNKKMVYVYAEQAIVGELLETITRPQVFNGQTVNEIMKVLLQETDWTVGVIESDGELYDFETDYQTTLKSINDLSEKTKLEKDYTLKMDGLNIKSKEVDMLKERGRRILKHFEYGINMNRVKRTKTSKDTITSVIGRGKDGLTIRSDDDLSHLIPEGFTHEGDFIYNNQSLEEKGRHVFSFIETDATSKPKLIEDMLDYLELNIKEKVTYECSIDYFTEITGEEPGVGDTIIVRDLTFTPPLLVEARVQEIVSSESNPEWGEIKLGNYKEIEVKSWEELRELREMVLQNAEKWSVIDKEQTIIKDQQQVIEQEQETIKDKQGSLEQEQEVIKDKQDKIVNEQEKHSQFLQEVNDKVIKQREDFAKEVTVIESNLEALSSQQEQSKEELIAKANTIQQQVDANKAQAEQVAGELNSKVQDLESTKTSIADFNQLKDNFDTNKTIIDGKLSEVTTDLVNVNNELSIKVNQKDYNVDKQSILTSIDEHTTQITQNSKEIASKASQHTVDGLTGRVNTAESSITQNANAIKSKVDNTVYQKDKAGITTDIKNANTAIEQNANDIKTKASTSSVNALTGRVSETESSITQQAGLIASKVDNTVYQQDKKGITTSIENANTAIEQNATDIKTKASQTSVNTLTGRVSNAESGITQNANAIKTKVDNTTYTKDKAGLITDIQNANTKIEQNATDIKTKASTSSVNALTGRVNSAESAITQNANEIKSKVSSTEVQKSLLENSPEIVSNSYKKNRNLKNATDSFIESNHMIQGIVGVVNIPEVDNLNNIVEFLNYSFIYSPLISAVDGSEYFASIDLNYKETTSGTVYCQLVFYDENKRPLGSNYSALNIVSNAPVSKPDTWQTFSGSIKFPDSDTVRSRASYVGVRWLFRYSYQTGVTYARNISFKAQGAELISTLETSITQTNKEIALKANKTDLDNLTGRVGKAESSITLNTNNIKLKVDNTTYNKQTQEFKSDISKIDQKADSISSTVSSNKVEQDGKITSMQSSITQQGNLISQKVSKGDVVSEINQSPTDVTIRADKINFDGHVFGHNATFTGDIEGALITGSEFRTKGDTGEELYLKDGFLSAGYNYGSTYASSEMTAKHIKVESKDTYWELKSELSDRELTIEDVYKEEKTTYGMNGIETNNPFKIESYGPITIQTIMGQPFLYVNNNKYTALIHDSNSSKFTTDNNIYEFDKMVKVQNATEVTSSGNNAVIRTRDKGSIIFLQTDWEVRAVKPLTAESYIPVRAASFPTASSIRYKTNIKNLRDFEAKRILDNLHPKEYHLNVNIESGIYDKPKMGFITEMSPSEVRDEDGIDVYSVVAMLTKNMQRQEKEIESLKKEIKDLYQTIVEL